MKIGVIVFLFFLKVSLLSANEITTAHEKLYHEIVNSIESVLGETVYEGEMRAEVSKVGEHPEMSCKLDQYRNPGKGIAKCDVTFNIESYYTEETETCQKSCFLIFVYDLESLQLVSRVEKLMEECVYHLSYSCD